MLNNNKDVFEKGVSKSDTVGNSGDDESVNLVEFIEGVVVSVNELEREWRESLGEYCGWRANFSRVGEVKASHVFRAVSYTHLDVYKRQGHCCARVNCK